MKNESESENKSVSKVNQNCKRRAMSQQKISRKEAFKKNINESKVKKSNQNITKKTQRNPSCISLTIQNSNSVNKSIKSKCTKYQSKINKNYYGLNKNKIINNYLNDKLIQNKGSQNKTIIKINNYTNIHKKYHNNLSMDKGKVFRNSFCEDKIGKKNPTTNNSKIEIIHSLEKKNHVNIFHKNKKYSKFINKNKNRDIERSKNTKIPVVTEWTENKITQDKHFRKSNIYSNTANKLNNNNLIKAIKNIKGLNNDFTEKKRKNIGEKIFNKAAAAGILPKRIPFNQKEKEKLKPFYSSLKYQN